jgi:hypothetical protein
VREIRETLREPFEAKNPRNSPEESERSRRVREIRENLREPFVL